MAGTPRKSSINSSSGDKTMKVEVIEMNSQNRGDPGTNFEDAIGICGNGLFSHAILLSAGIIFLHCGFQNGISAYILPAAKCDLELSSGEMGAVNAAFLAGGISSAYIWGLLADALGRRPVLVAALVLDSIFSLISTLSPSFIVFAGFRFLSGAFVGGPASLIFLYVGEFIRLEVRPRYMLLVGGFWMLSWMMLPGIAWLILPQPWNFQFLWITINSWRVMLALLTIPGLISAVLAWQFPETPLYLASQGRQKEALAVLSKIYAINNRCSPDKYPVKTLSSPSGNNVGGPSSQGAQGLKSIMSVARRMWKDAYTLFKPPVLWPTFLSCVITFANMFSYYGFALWIPELLNRFEVYNELHPNKSLTVCELSRVWEDEVQGVITVNDQSFASPICKSEEAVNETVFKETLIISAACLAANIISAIFAAKAGRKALPGVLNVVSGVLGAAIYFANSATVILILSSLFQALIGTGNTAINGFLVDIFPAHVSALGVCSAILAGRLGAAVSNIVLGTLLDVTCEVPIFLLAASVLVGGLLCALVPEPYSAEDSTQRTRRLSLLPTHRLSVISVTTLSSNKPSLPTVTEHP